MPIPLPRIRTPEPRSIVAFIKAGHPWLGFMVSITWLLSPIAILALLIWLKVQLTQ